MGLQLLPPEILAQIVDTLVPAQWYQSPASHHECMRLRLVSRIFNDAVLDILFRTSNRFALLVRSKLWNECTMIWLLSTKARLDRPGRDKTCTYLRQWASLMALQKCWPSDDAENYNLWLEVACRATVQELGLAWVRECLVCSDNEVTKMNLDLNLPEKLSATSVSLSPEGPLRLRPETAQGAIQLACCRGDVRGVKFLLSRGADPTSHHPLFGLPLYRAVRNGHSKIVKCVLDYGPVILPHRGYEKLLMIAVNQGHSKVFQHLLHHTTSVENHVLYTCMYIACQQGRADIVRTLYKWGDADAGQLRQSRGWAQRWAERLHSRIYRSGSPKKATFNPDRFMEIAKTPMNQAAKNGHVEVIRILVKRPEYHPCDPIFEWCPLLAAEDANVARILLDTYNKSKKMHKKVGIPFIAACKAGNLPVVKAFLEWPYLDPNTTALEGSSTALNEVIMASSTYPRIGNVDVVCALLKHPKTDPNLAPPGKSKPLETAIENKQMAIAEILISRADVDPNLNGGYFSPLCLAIEAGNLALVRQLLQRPDTDPNLKSNYNDWTTPLMTAIYKENIAAVEELLKRNDLDPNLESVETSPLNALFFAAGKGYETCVKLLLTRPDIDINFVSSNKTTPLANAVIQGRIGIVALLLKNDKIDPNFAPELTNTKVRMLSDIPQHSRYELWSLSSGENLGSIKQVPLCLAAERRNLRLVRLLVEHPRIDIHMTDGSGRTALWWALFGGLLKLVRLLLDHGAGATINAQDVQGWAALHVAANYARPVGDLLGHPDIDVNIVNKNGCSPLHIAIKTNNIDAMSKLLNHPKIDKRLPMKDGTTPLQLAKDFGLQKMIEQLREDAT